MLEWLHRIFIGHAHTWVEQEQIKLISTDGKSVVGIMILSRCAQCGKLNQDKITHNLK